MFDKLRQGWRQKEMEKRIQQHGWVAAALGDYERGRSWFYTIGFDETLSQPELILFDMPSDIANGVLWRAYRDLKSGVLRLEDGAPWVVEGDPVGVWRRVHASQIDGPDGWFASALSRREQLTGSRGGLQAFQLVGASPDGRYPWENGYDESIRFKQPALYLACEPYYADGRLGAEGRAALRLVRERGWDIVLIDGPVLKWAYTLGLSDTPDLPELIAMLPSANGAANMLRDALALVRSGDLVLSDDLKWNGLGFECCWRKVHESQFLALNLFFLTKLRHELRTGRREALDAYQLFLPDNAGRYPWEPGCADMLRRTQPLLFEPFNGEELRSGPLAALMRG
jgi:hypothetical protein